MAKCGVFVSLGPRKPFTVIIERMIVDYSTFQPELCSLGFELSVQVGKKVVLFKLSLHCLESLTCQ